MRKKSYDERRRTTFLISFSLTAVIAFVWGTLILPQTLTLQEAESSRATTVSPFSTLAEDVSLIFGDIQVGVNELGKEFNRLRSSANGEQQEETAPLTTPRDESFFIDSTGEFSLPSTYSIDPDEIQGALEEGEEGVDNDAGILSETEAELEIEG